MTIPDYLPMLIKGTGNTPLEGGCLVQIANWLHDPELWTDQAICVDRVLAHWAIMINDLLDDDHRRQLSLLAPRLAGTKISDRGVELEVTQQIQAWFLRNPNPLTVDNVRTQRWTQNGLIIDIDHRLVIYPIDQQTAVNWLSALIDEYDRITTRPAVPVLTEAQSRTLCKVMGQ